MVILAFLALTTIAAFASYLAGYSAGEREQMRQTLRDIGVLRRAEDDRVQVDPYVTGLTGLSPRSSNSFGSGDRARTGRDLRRVAGEDRPMK
jgi:hypothetical protein